MEVKVYLKDGTIHNYKLDVTFDVDAESQQILFPLILEMIKEHGIDIRKVAYVNTFSIDKINK